MKYVLCLSLKTAPHQRQLQKQIKPTESSFPSCFSAMMEAVKLKVLDKSKTTLTVEWEWQNKSEPIRVNEYRVALSKHTEIKSRPSKVFY